MELTLEQTQQGVSYEVSVQTELTSFTMEDGKSALSQTSNKLMVGRSSRIRRLLLKMVVVVPDSSCGSQDP
ncbi:hypothetical protein Tco_0777801 [Tanacetum coccineum]